MFDPIKAWAGRDVTFIIVGRTLGCKWCCMARALLAEHSLAYDFFEAKGTIARLMQSMRFSTVPRIWHGPTYVGGYDDLVVYLRDRPHL
jgi:glutaredoxin